MNRAVIGALALAGCVWDVNGDGEIVVGCLGDSNSAFPFGLYCEQLAAAYPDLTFVSYAIPGTRAIGGPNDGLAQIAAAAAGTAGPPADVVLLAFGTNDIGGNGAITAEEMASRVATLMDAASDAGMPPFVATIPPRFLARATEGSPCVENPLSTPVIEAANALIRGQVDPAWLVDFDAGFDCPVDFATDGVHMSAAGVEKRAERFADRLFFVP